MNCRFMEGEDRLLAPLGLIVFGLFIFFGTGSESELLDSILPYVFSSPFLLSGFFILSVRLGELTMGDLSNLEIDTSSPESIFNSMENYSKFKQQEGKYAVQATGYLLLSITITVSVFTVLIGLGWLLLLAAFSGMGSSGGDEFENSFNFFISILKICFWTYIASHVLIARPWALFIEDPPLDSSKTVVKETTTEPGKIEQKRLLYCPKCAAAIRVPMEYKGRAKCPKCEEIFEA